MQIGHTVLHRSLSFVYVYEKGDNTPVQVYSRVSSNFSFIETLKLPCHRLYFWWFLDASAYPELKGGNTERI